MNWIYIIVIGAIIGYIAGLLMRGGGFGIIGNIVVGILGSFVGGWLSTQFNIQIGEGLVNTIATGVLGAAVVLFVTGLFSGKKRR
ncbi:MAG: GlsB/YeaQ/YmgE family stress response membrane protein [Saprospiraceae bacterium]